MHEQFCFTYEGQKFPFQKRFITLAELREVVGEPDAPIVLDQDDGGDVTLVEGERYDLGKPCRFGVSADFKRGRDVRLEAEIAYAQREYPTLTVSETGWAEIPDYVFPQGRFNRESGLIAFQIPPNYNGSAPDNFFVEPGLTLSSGEPISNYGGGTAPNGRQMGVFSFHAKKWNPSNDVERGDNLLTFLRAVRLRLQEGR